MLFVCLSVSANSTLATALARARVGRQSQEGCNVDTPALCVFDVDVDVRHIVLDGTTTHHAHFLARFYEVTDKDFGVDSAKVHVSNAVTRKRTIDGLHHDDCSRSPRTVGFGEVVYATVTGKVVMAGKRDRSGSSVDVSVFHVRLTETFRIVLGATDKRYARAGHCVEGSAKATGFTNATKVESSVGSPAWATVAERREDIRDRVRKHNAGSCLGDRQRSSRQVSKSFLPIAHRFHIGKSDDRSSGVYTDVRRRVKVLGQHRDVGMARCVPRVDAP